MTTYKTAKTCMPYAVNFKGYQFVIPAGSVVSNNTAFGPDDNYHFWADYFVLAEKLTGCTNSGVLHDLTYYGINIPAEYCYPYGD